MKKKTVTLVLTFTLLAALCILSFLSLNSVSEGTDGGSLMNGPFLSRSGYFSDIKKISFGGKKTDSFLMSSEKSTKAASGTGSSLEEEILRYKDLAAGFDTSRFGGSITNAAPAFGYPTVYPTVGEHPRVMINNFNLDKIKNEINTPENHSVKTKYLSLSENNITGEFPERVNNDVTNADRQIICSIEAKAFRYLMTGEELYGYQAIYAIKNAMLTIDAAGRPDSYRDYGILMYVTACVYDWCYDLLTQTDIQQIACGAVNLLGKRFEVGWPPQTPGDISHHNLECQFLRSYLSLAIAIYDDYPVVYNYVAGRIYNNFVPAQNFMLQSGRHWEGSGYGPSRTYYLMWGQYLIYAMTDGQGELFDSNDLQRVCNTLLQFKYPGATNGHSAFEIGDQCNQYLSDYYYMAFFAGNYFKDPGLIDFANDELSNGNNVNTPGLYGFSWITPVTYLIIHDTDPAASDPDYTACEWDQNRNLIELLDYPQSGIFARNSWKDEANDRGIAVYMNMNEFFSGSHSHMDTGSFQIYYKGILVSDSGVYDGYGTEHHYGYSMQTISSNSILVYNSDNARSLGLNDPPHPYSGGQRLRAPSGDKSRWHCPDTLEEARGSSSMDQCTVLGKSGQTANGEYQYSYIAGDMTGAYDSVTVSEVTRHMLSVMTGNENYPMVFITYDRVNAKKSKYKKTILLHSRQEPEINGGYVILKSQNGGRLVVQSLITDMTATVLGKANQVQGSEYVIGGYTEDQLTDATGTDLNIIKPNNYETLGRKDYRVDLSPSAESEKDYMLTCMYVTDAGNSVPVAAESINTSDLAGAVLFDKVMCFAKNANRISGNYTFTSGSASGNAAEYYIAGVKDGLWSYKINDGATAVTVSKEGESLIRFAGGRGNITINFECVIIPRVAPTYISDGMKKHYEYGGKFYDVNGNEVSESSLTIPKLEASARINDNYYATVTDAVKAAVSGDTIVLISNVTETYLNIYNGVTVDLNGQIITADYVSAFPGNHIIDTATEKGLLRTARNNVHFQLDNTYMPVWNNTDGFVFVNLLMHKQTLTKTEQGASLKFRPEFEDYDTGYRYFNDGAEDNGLKIAVRVTWTKKDRNSDSVYKVIYEVTVTDNYVKDVYSIEPSKGLREFTANVMGIDDPKFQNVKISFTVTSDTGVKITSEGLST